jgi:hypothetical protein
VTLSAIVIYYKIIETQWDVNRSHRKMLEYSEFYVLMKYTSYLNDMEITI